MTAIGDMARQRNHNKPHLDEPRIDPYRVFAALGMIAFLFVVVAGIVQICKWIF